MKDESPLAPRPDVSRPINVQPNDAILNRISQTERIVGRLVIDGHDKNKSKIDQAIGEANALNWVLGLN